MKTFITSIKISKMRFKEDKTAHWLKIRRDLWNDLFMLNNDGYRQDITTFPQGTNVVFHCSNHQMIYAHKSILSKSWTNGEEDFANDSDIDESDINDYLDIAVNTADVKQELQDEQYTYDTVRVDNGLGQSTLNDLDWMSSEENDKNLI